MKPSKFSVLLNRVALSAVACGLILLTACTSPRLERAVSDYPLGVAYEPENFYSIGTLPAGVRRVALMPFYTNQGEVIDRERFNEMLRGQLRRRSNFEIFTIDEARLERLIGQRQLSTQEKMPLALIDYLEDAGVDAVFQLDVAEYSAYRPYVLGVNACLTGLKDSQVFWAIDEFFRSTDKKVVTAAREYAASQEAMRYPYSDSYAALRGPFLYSEFVIYTVAETLPASARD